MRLPVFQRSAVVAAAVALIWVPAAWAQTLGFDIRVVWHAQTITPSTAEVAAFAAAEAFWESVIRGYAVDIGTFDTTLTVQARVVSSLNGALGEAGVTQHKQVSRVNVIPHFGNVQIVRNLGGATLGGVVLHEVAHVMGFGTAWDRGHPWNLGAEYAPGDPTRYVGPHALAAYRRDFDPSAAYIPLDSSWTHWAESSRLDPLGRSLRNELMTPFLDNPVYVGDVTVQSFRDIGYLLVPEPATLVMFAVGVLTVGARRRGDRTGSETGVRG